MKKLFVWMLALACVVGLAGCGGQQEEEQNGQQDYFDAEVLSVHETYVSVECLEETSGAVSSGTEVTVSTDVVHAEGVPELTEGDCVRVVFDGVQETYPVQLHTVFAIYLLDENGEAIDPT